MNLPRAVLLYVGLKVFDAYMASTQNVGFDWGWLTLGSVGLLSMSIALADRNSTDQEVT